MSYSGSRRSTAHDKVTSEARSLGNDRYISQLNRENTYLQDHINELERKLEATMAGEVTARHHATNADIEKSMMAESLRIADAEAKKLTRDKHVVVDIADRELEDAKNELVKSRSELEKVDISVAQLQAENSHLQEQNGQLTRSLTFQTGDMDQLEALVDKLQDDKRKLAIRCNKLISTEKELVAEVDRLKRKRGGEKASARRNRSPNRFDQFIKTVEQDRDYWRAEVDTLQQIIKYRKLGEAVPGASRSRAHSTKPSRTQSVRDRSLSPLKSSVRESKLESALRTAEDERDYYKREFELYKSLTTRPSQKLSPRDLENGSNSELRRVMRERDELQSLLDKFERHMAEIQTNVKVLTTERDRLSHLHQEAKDELQRTRHELLNRAPATTTHPQLAKAHSVISKIEQERDEAMSDLRRVMVERDSLRERFKVSSDTHVADRAHLEQQIEDLNTKTISLNKDRNQLELQIGNLKSQMVQLEDDLRARGVKEQELSSAIDQHKATITQMKLLSNDRESTISECQRSILLKEDELQSARRQCAELEDRLINANKMCSELRSEGDMKSGELSRLMTERDSMQQHLAEKSSQCVHLNKDLSRREDELNHCSRTNRETRSQLDGLEEALMRKDKEMHELKFKLQEYQNVVSELKLKRAKTSKEVKLLEEDLATLSSENDRLNRDIQDVLIERQQLADQAQEYVTEVKRVEDILSQKDADQARLLQQYKVMTSRAESFESNASRLEGERTSLKSMVLSKDTQIKKLSDQLNLLDKECQQNRLAQQAMESQLGTQERTIGQMEDKLCNHEKERHTLCQELLNTRESVVQVDSSRDELERLLAAKEMELNKAQISVSNMEREIYQLKERSNSDRTRLASLEQTLASNREKEFHSQLAVQESTSEVQLMRERLAMNETKIDSQTREMGQLRNRIAELEADLERARRHVTNERFEKERAFQELRRSGSTTPINPRSGYTTPNYISPGDPLSPSRTALSSVSRYRTSSSTSINLNTSNNNTTTANLNSSSLADWIHETDRKVASMAAASDALIS